MALFRVVVEGKTLPGFSLDDVRPRLAALINRSEEVAGRLLSGQPSAVKSGVDQATATRYVNAITAIGVACRLERETLEIDVSEPKRDEGASRPVDALLREGTQPPPRTEKAHDEKFCAECGAVIKAKAEICPKCGVRQALPIGATSGKPGERRCTNCGAQGTMKTWLRNYSLPQLLAIVLLLFWVLPGVIFIAWAWGKYKCPHCGKVGENVPA